MHYAFYTNTILIIWCHNEDENEGETNCHKDCDKGSYTVMDYDSIKCILYSIHLRTDSYIRTNIIA